MQMFAAARWRDGTKNNKKSILDPLSTVMPPLNSCFHVSIADPILTNKPPKRKFKYLLAN